MPRAPDGTYSLPSGTIVNTGDTLLTSQHNPGLLDIATAMGASLDRDGLGGMRASLSMGGNLIHDVSPGVSPDDVVTVAQLSGISGMPVGTIVDFAGSTVPDGWLLCAGQSLNRTDYAALFTAIGTAYGSASGSTFNLPDCRGRVSAGRDLDSGGLADRLTSTTMTPNGTTLGALGGAQTVTLTSGQMPSHTHTGSTSSAGAHTHSVPNAGSVNIGAGAFSAGSDVDGDTSSAGTHSHSITLDNTGGGEAHANVQPTILFNKLIKAS